MPSAVQRDAEGTCAYGRGRGSSEVILNHVSDVLQGIQESHVVHPAFLGKSQPRRVVLDLFEPCSHPFAIPFLLECFPNLSFNRIKLNSVLCWTSSG